MSRRRVSGVIRVGFLVFEGFVLRFFGWSAGFVRGLVVYWI